MTTDSHQVERFILVLLVSIGMPSCHRQPVRSSSAPSAQPNGLAPPVVAARTEPVSLLADWDPGATNNTYYIRYRFANQSVRTIYPTRDNYSGVVERWDGEAWVYIIGGVICRSGMSWHPLASGAKVASPLYAKYPMLLRRGRYRYRVTYSLDDWDAPDRRVESASSEFEIDSSSLRTAITNDELGE